MKIATIYGVTLGLMGVALILTLVNAWNMTGLTTLPISVSNSGLSAAQNTLVDTGNLVKSEENKVALDVEKVLPKGIPLVYGTELSVSFDDVSAKNAQLADATIRKLAALDQSITLEGDDLSRYIKITNSISCEYCCGAPAITDAEGNPACGCAHSYAMRGLAKYLITQHGSEFSDEQILDELGKWKTLFFPSALAQKAKALEDNGIEFNYVNLASNLYRGIEKQKSSSGGNMVGGC